MKQDFFKNVPSEIVIDILSRLPVRSVISCKCVHKSWLHLVGTREFVKSHLSKSSPGLIISENSVPQQSESKFYQFFEFEDGFDVEHHDLHYKLVTKFHLNNVGATIMGSTDGLVLLCKLSASDTKSDSLYICNPITRDYINLDCPPEFCDSYRTSATYGFGSSKVSSQYKVVRIFHHHEYNQEVGMWLPTSNAECCVYTLGTGSWRRGAYCDSLAYKYLLNIGQFANGNLHWLTYDLSVSQFFLKISCFDLETEHFSTLPIPFPWNGDVEKSGAVEVFAWGNCLGLSDHTSGDEIVIWLMKEYGDEKSWTKEFVLSTAFKLEYFEPDIVLNSLAYPIKVFKDGDILMLWNEYIIYYSNKTKTTHEVDIFERSYEDAPNAMLHTPSFLSLKSLGLENVKSF